MPTLTIHTAEQCPLASKPCALHLLANGVPACAHPALGYPIEAGNEMPERCPCEPAARPRIQTSSPSQIATARIARKNRARWS